ncbi:hypothetical protein [Bacillus pinisoli]|uniref:hypothetical protein n=1 Tax=Bacillus pinisoli TaxID=2901866 RepID=UPI001FF3FE18|nr:hypothetical protein [Bacillus pinisoli]
MKKIQKGNTTIVIHSHLADLDKEEQKSWFTTEWANNNKVLKAIVEAAVACEIEEDE